MKSQRRFAPNSGEFAPESVARFTGIRNQKYAFFRYAYHSRYQPSIYFKLL